jgi:hypothetical protein
MLGRLTQAPPVRLEVGFGQGAIHNAALSSSNEK